MYTTRVVSDIIECRDLWGRSIPENDLFDVWGARMCFHKYLNWNPHFIIAEDGSGLCGLLPLSEIKDHNYYGYFPGEVCAGKTWIEQNKIHAINDDVYNLLIEAAPQNLHIRYLNRQTPEVDEIGYLFRASKYNYDMNGYWGEFSSKSRRKIQEEIMQFDVRWRFEDSRDIDALIQMNIKSFGETSFFTNEKFCRGFIDFMEFAKERKMLRVVTALIGDKIVATDVGVIHKDSCTLLAGATDPEFKGIAKAINLKHMEWACENKIGELDFLCGDFGWKDRFHLERRPLYQVKTPTLNGTTHFTPGSYGPKD